MASELMANPFVVGRYAGDEYFCDREKETEYIIKQIVNGRNLALISPRRMGKTGLIEHSLHCPQIAGKYNVVIVDIYATTSLAEMVYLLSKAVFDVLRPRGRQLLTSFFQVVGSLRVGFKVDAISGEPSLDIGLGDIRKPDTTLDEIFDFMENAERPTVLAIDEFQQIGVYSEKNVEALLRTKIQRCKRTAFVFSGSRRHVMANMFTSPSKPFYQSSITMGLDPIPMPVYTAFAQGLFERYGKMVAAEVVETVYNQMCGCTWFVQMMMNELFALTREGETCKPEKISEALTNVVAMQEDTYRDVLNRLAPRQKQLLLAIAHDGIASKLTSADFISRHSLPSASAVQSALRSLLSSDIVTQDGDSYRVYDHFFGIWLRGY